MRIFYGVGPNAKILGFGILWFQTPVKQKIL